MLSAKRYEAAMLVAEDRLKKGEMAARLGISRRCLEKWRNQPEFKAEVERILNAWQEEVLQKGIGDQRRRIYRVNAHWRGLLEVVRQRAVAGRKFAKEWKADPANRGQPFPFPGLDTGYVVVKPTRYGPVSEVDTGLLAELRAIDEHAATDLGQWKTKTQLVGENDGPPEIRVVFVSPKTETEPEPEPGT